jgi:predicted nuclease with TOPRIM domain
MEISTEIALLQRRAHELQNSAYAFSKRVSTLEDKLEALERFMGLKYTPHELAPRPARYELG